MQDGAAVTGLAIAAASLVAVNKTGNPIYDPIGSIIVGNLLGMVCVTHITYSSKSNLILSGFGINVDINESFNRPTLRLIWVVVRLPV